MCKEDEGLATRCPVLLCLPLTKLSRARSAAPMSSGASRCERQASCSVNTRGARCRRCATGRLAPQPPAQRQEERECSRAEEPSLLCSCEVQKASAKTFRLQAATLSAPAWQSAPSGPSPLSSSQLLYSSARALRRLPMVLAPRMPRRRCSAVLSSSSCMPAACRGGRMNGHGGQNRVCGRIKPRSKVVGGCQVPRERACQLLPPLCLPSSNALTCAL